MNVELIFAALGGLGAMLGWGISDYFAKKSVDKVGHSVAIFWMQALGIIPLFIFFLFSLDITNFKPSQILIVALLAIADAIGYLMFYKALEKGKVSIISPITSSYAAFSVIISAIFFHEYLSLKIILVLGLIFIGIVLASISRGESKENNAKKEKWTKGVPEAIIGVILFSVLFPFWDRTVSNGNWLILLILLRLFMSIFLFGANKIKRQRIKIENRSVIYWLLIIGLLDAIAYISLTWAYNATKYTSVITMLSAIFSLPTLILARIFLKERLGKIQIFGVTLILIGLACLGFI